MYFFLAIFYFEFNAFFRAFIYGVSACTLHFRRERSERAMINEDAVGFEIGAQKLVTSETGSISPKSIAFAALVILRLSWR